MTEYELLLPPRAPRGIVAEPEVPGCVDTVKPGSRAQHSSIEAMSLAPMVVTLRVCGIDVDCAEAGAEKTTARVLVKKEREEEILWSEHHCGFWFLFFKGQEAREQLSVIVLFTFF